MMIRLFVALILALLLLQLSCKKSPTEPEFKSPREYTWTATQLQYPGAYNLSMYSIWASGPTDIYVSGFSILGGQKGAMFHYDGKQWAAVVLPSPDYNYLWEVTGFGANDIWAAGSRLFPDPSLDSAAILHYDGVRWTQMLPSHMGVRGLKSLGGSSTQNLFFGSRDGKVIRYNGVWSIDTLYLGLSVRDIGGDEERVFAVGNTFRGALDDSVMCFMRVSNSWQLIDLQLLTQYSAVPRFGASNVYSPAPGDYYSAGELGIFHWQETRWVKVFSPIAVVLGLAGSSASILAVGRNNDGPVIYHWDGASWEEIKLPEGIVPDNVLLFGVWTNGKEAFIVGNNGAVSYVLHGK
jgi:hypothetical protein